MTKTIVFRELQIGDVVRANSGGPKMTIVGLPTADKPGTWSYDRYECQWWQQKAETYTSMMFSPEVLELVTTP